jgi:NADH-quinone oxidoreductase subunit E
VKEVASFYAMFNETAIGKRHVRVCTGLSCCLRGARSLQDSFEEELNIRPGEVSDDGCFSIGSVECLGSCGSAPVLQINTRTYLENLSASDAPAILENLRREIAEDEAETA